MGRHSIHILILLSISIGIGIRAPSVVLLLLLLLLLPSVSFASVMAFQSLRIQWKYSIDSATPECSAPCCSTHVSMCVLCECSGADMEQVGSVFHKAIGSEFVPVGVDLMEAIIVKLPNKAGEVGVLESPREELTLHKIRSPHSECPSRVRPAEDVIRAGVAHEVVCFPQKRRYVGPCCWRIARKI